MGADTNQNVTLSSILSILSPLDRIFILHRIGLHELEAVGGGTVQEMRTVGCLEACGDNIVEYMELAADEPNAEWMDMDTPVLVITIGGKDQRSR